MVGSFDSKLVRLVEIQREDVKSLDCGLVLPRSVAQFHPLIGIGLPKCMPAELRRVSSLHANRAVHIHRKNVEGS